MAKTIFDLSTAEARKTTKGQMRAGVFHECIAIGTVVEVYTGVGTPFRRFIGTVEIEAVTPIVIHNTALGAAVSSEFFYFNSYIKFLELVGFDGSIEEYAATFKTYGGRPFEGWLTIWKNFNASSAGVKFND